MFKAMEMIAKTLTLVEDVLRTQQISVNVEATDDAEIYGSIGECCQVLLNLLMNSCDAFVERGQEEQRKIAIKAFPEGAKTVIIVSDNAGGIPEDILARIFDPYFTTKAPEHGTGLGLFMARTIVETQMTGTITVRNLDAGAEFRLEVNSRGQ